MPGALDWQNAPDGDWSDWSGPGGMLASDPTVGAHADGRLPVFVRGIDDELGTRHQTAIDGPWSGWQSRRGTPTSGVAVARTRQESRVRHRRGLTGVNEARRARAGVPHVVVLPGLGTAGYQWFGHAPPGVRVEPQERTEPVTDLPVGRSLDDVFHVTADEPGTYHVTFEQRRPWENGVAPLETRQIELVVDP